MHSTAIDRRTFLALAGAASLTPWQAAQAAEEALFLGARRNGGRFEAAILDGQGRDRLVLPLEARGHSFAINRPRRRAVAFARAPGRFAIAFSLDGGGEPVPVAPPPDRHFYGHGVFTPDGRLLLAAENDYEAGRGVTGVYDVEAGFRRLGEFSTAGVGPHELVLMPDGKTICVANGGILTRPDYDGVKLNLNTMEPSLAYLDIATGEVVDKVRLAPELHQLSIRHLAIAAAGAVWFGCQYHGDAADDPPLVGRHRRGGEIELFPGPAETLRSLRNYVGSVATDESGSMVATSSPRGGVVLFWDAASGRCLGSRDLADGCGVAPAAANEVMATSGRGAVMRIGPDAKTALRSPDPSLPAWDNHLRRV